MSLPKPNPYEYETLLRSQGPLSWAQVEDVPTLDIDCCDIVLRAYRAGRVRGDEIRSFVFAGRQIAKDEALYCGVPNGDEHAIWWVGGV